MESDAIVFVSPSLPFLQRLLTRISFSSHRMSAHRRARVSTTLRKHDGCVPVSKSVKRTTGNSQPLPNGMQHLSADVLRPQSAGLCDSQIAMLARRLLLPRLQRNKVAPPDRWCLLDCLVDQFANPACGRVWTPCLKTGDQLFSRVDVVNLAATCRRD